MQTRISWGFSCRVVEADIPAGLRAACHRNRGAMAAVSVGRLICHTRRAGGCANDLTAH